jgi:hypothetical protein
MQKIQHLPKKEIMGQLACIQLCTCVSAVAITVLHVDVGPQPVNQPVNRLTANRFGPVLNFREPVNQLVNRFTKIRDRSMTGHSVNIHCETFTERRGTIVDICEPFKL